MLIVSLADGGAGGSRRRPVRTAGNRQRERATDESREGGDGPGEDKYTTPTVEPLNAVDVDALGLGVPGMLTVGTLPTRRRASASTRPASSPASTTSCCARSPKSWACESISSAPNSRPARPGGIAALRRRLLVDHHHRRPPAHGRLHQRLRLRLLLAGRADGVVDHRLRQARRRPAHRRCAGHRQEAYVIDSLHLDPVKFPDYNTVYASLKTRQIDAWVAPSQQAQGTCSPATGQIIENTFSLDNFVAYAVAKENQPLIDALNSGLDAVIADGTWSRLYSDWVPRELPPGWKPGSKAAPRHSCPTSRPSPPPIEERPRSVCGAAEIDAVPTGGLLPGLGPVQAGDPRCCSRPACRTR